MSYFTVNLIMGTVFSILGTAVLLLVQVLNGHWLARLLGLWFLIMGLRFLFGFLARFYRQAKVRSDGLKFTGKIVDYFNDEEKNYRGKPHVRLVVEYKDENDETQETLLETGSHDETLFPIGARVTFFRLGERAAIAPQSVL